jgi:hypothetical protein
MAQRLFIDVEALKTVLDVAPPINAAGSLAEAEKQALVRLDKLQSAAAEFEAQVTAKRGELAEAEKKLNDIRDRYAGPAPSARQGRAR